MGRGSKINMRKAPVILDLTHLTLNIIRKGTLTLGTLNEIKTILGTSVLNPRAGFLRIFTVAFDRLF